MCKALKDWLEEERTKALTEGHAEGHAKGHAEGHAEGIVIGVIKTSRKYGASLEEIVVDLMDNYHFDEDKAREFCEQYK